MDCKQERKKAQPRIPILTWLRKRIDLRCLAWSYVDKTGYTRTSIEDFRRYYGKLADGKKAFLPTYSYEMFARHCQGAITAHFQAEGALPTPETLIAIDIDCHERGSQHGALACIDWLRENGFPGLYYTRSTTSQGGHAYLVVDKRGVGPEALSDGLAAFQRGLRRRASALKWDIQGIEVKGRPRVIQWARGNYVIEHINLGTTCRLPTDLLDRPAELIATPVKSLAELAALEVEATPLIGCADAVAGEDASHRHVSGTSQTNPGWIPDMRSREWPKWALHVATHGLPVEDNLGVVLHELAKWLLWVELYGQDPGHTAYLLQRFVDRRHNGLISRLGTKPHEVYSQIDRAIKLALRIDSAGQRLFERIRRKRRNGDYQSVYRISPTLSEDDQSPLSINSSLSTYSGPLSETGQEEEEGDQSPISPTLSGDDQSPLPINSSLSTYSGPLSETPAPIEIESQLAKIIQINKFRKKAGEYPFLTFARKLLNLLWDQDGHARLGQQILNEMSATPTKHKNQLAWKRALQEGGLLEDHTGTYRSKAASSLYRLTPEVKAAFQRAALRDAALRA